MYALNRELDALENPDSTSRLQRNIEIVAGQINNLVYKIYELNEDEVKIVANSERERLKFEPEVSLSAGQEFTSTESPTALPNFCSRTLRCKTWGQPDVPNSGCSWMA